MGIMVRAVALCKEDEKGSNAMDTLDRIAEMYGIPREGVIHLAHPMWLVEIRYLDYTYQAVIGLMETSVHQTSH